MADNVTLDPGAGGAVVATDDAGAAGHVQIIKLAVSADGSAAVIPADATNGIYVDVKQSALPSGAATSAKQDTIIGHVDGIEGLLTTIDADTGTVAGAVSGTEMQVDVVAALPAGTNNIGDVDIASIAAGDNNIGNVDIASIAAGDNNIGNVDVASSALPTGASTLAEQQTQTTALQLIDDTVFVDDASFTVTTSKVNAIGLYADQTSTDSVNEGDIGIPRMTLDRKQITTVAPSSDTEGLDVFRSADMDETEEDVKTAPGKVYGWVLYNDGASEVFVQLWNATAANTTPGTTTPKITFPLAAGASANVEYTNGITFDTAISVGATTGFSDAGAQAAAQVSGCIFYK